MTKVAQTKVSLKWSTVIPAEARPWLDVKVGDFLEWHVENGHVELKKQQKK